MANMLFASIIHALICKKRKRKSVEEEEDGQNGLFTHQLTDNSPQVTGVQKRKLRFDGNEKRNGFAMAYLGSYQISVANKELILHNSFVKKMSQRSSRFARVLRV